VLHAFAVGRGRDTVGKGGVLYGASQFGGISDNGTVFAITPIADACANLLAKLDGQLPLRLGHFTPEFLQVCLQRLVLRFLTQGQGEPPIGGRQVSGSA
jgi:hypothetical protein